MRCEICHTDHAPYQAHVFPSQRQQNPAPHAGLYTGRTCQECAKLRAANAILQTENDALRAALDAAMSTDTAEDMSTKCPPEDKVSTKQSKRRTKDGGQIVKDAAYWRERKRAQRAAKKAG